MTGGDSSLWTADAIFSLMPEGTDEASVAGLIEDLGIATSDPVWRLEHLNVLRDIDDTQLHDDDDDAEGLRKIDQYTERLLTGDRPPPMMGVRYSGGQVQLADGRHRYNACLKAGVVDVPVWVAPVPE